MRFERIGRYNVTALLGEGGMGTRLAMVPPCALIPP